VGLSAAVDHAHLVMKRATTEAESVVEGEAARIDRIVRTQHNGELLFVPEGKPLQQRRRCSWVGDD
jgi:hypothetical protein